MQAVIALGAIDLGDLQGSQAQADFYRCGSQNSLFGTPGSEAYNAVQGILELEQKGSILFFYFILCLSPFLLDDSLLLRHRLCYSSDDGKYFYWAWDAWASSQAVQGCQLPCCLGSIFLALPLSFNLGYISTTSFNVP